MTESLGGLMTRAVTAIVGVLVFLTGHTVSAQTKAKAENVPEIQFQSVPNFLKLPPNLYLGEGIGVATNSKGHVFVYTRSGDTRLFEFDQSGAFVRDRPGFVRVRIRACGPSRS